jgi:hypothetical protein
MATQKQIEANRRNAQKSSGPRTPEGRAAVRLNGVKHGLTARTLVLEGESEADFKDLLDSLEAEHQPATPTEQALVQQLAMAAWRLRRAYHMEAGFMNLQLIDTRDSAENDYTNLENADRLALAIEGRAHTLNILNRHEARLERSFYRALHELQRLRAHRPAKAKDAEKVEEVEKADEAEKVENQTQSPCSDPVPDRPGKPKSQPIPVATAINGAHEINISNETRQKDKFAKF